MHYAHGNRFSEYQKGEISQIEMTEKKGFESFFCQSLSPERDGGCVCVRWRGGGCCVEAFREINTQSQIAV